jgi:hypothetical protein
MTEGELFKKGGDCKMPFGDKTGPLGLGPRTGRGMGYCAGFSGPGFMSPFPGRGWFGFGRGRGGGRGWFAGGRGRGFGWFGRGRRWRYWYGPALPGQVGYGYLPFRSYV